MLRSILLALIFSLLEANFVAPARAELWQGANTQRPHQVSVGGYGQIYFNPSGEFQGFFTGMYGFTPRVQGELRLGAGTQDVYLGAFSKYHFFSSEVIQMALWGGLHVQNSAALDAALIVSHSFRNFEIYIAPTVQLAFEGANLGVGVIPGFGLFLSKNTKLFVEGVFDVNRYFDAMSVGLRYYL